MTAKIVSEFKQNISAMTLMPQAGGKFELEVDGELIYSKLASGSFPDEAAILQLLRERA